MEVENEGKEVLLSDRWAVTEKKNLTYKARFIAQRFEETYKGNKKTNSPTCCKESYRLIHPILQIESRIIVQS